MKIFKYTLPIKQTMESRFSRSIPKGAKFLSMDVQYEVPCLWFLVEPTAECEERHFEILGTGIECQILSTDIFLRSFQLNNGTFVEHVFETTRSPR